MSHIASDGEVELDGQLSDASEEDGEHECKPEGKASRRGAAQERKGTKRKERRRTRNKIKQKTRKLGQKCRKSPRILL